jgi:hypothetical protein
MKPGDLKHFARGLRSAAKFGVEPEYRKRFKRLRHQGMVELEAAETALRQAVNALNPRAKLGLSLSMREGKS